MERLNQEIILTCKSKLIELRASLLNQFQTYRHDFQTRETGGDEVDQSINILTETQLLASGQRIRGLIFEVEDALGRIEKNQYGICEETQEPIEVARLLALPWTRVSLEGAEIRESLQKAR